MNISFPENDDFVTDIARKVYNGLTAYGFDLGEWEHYLGQCIAALRAGNTGGLVIVKTGRVGWVDMYCAGFGVRPPYMQAMMQASLVLDIDYLAVDCERSQNREFSRKLCRKLGFQQVNEYLFALKCTQAEVDIELETVH